ncbi:MAG TPA: Ku protein [Solirubrobacteraceae bacterium]|nr:Ku protein [Solirubrobacteraceae bacterium]
MPRSLWNGTIAFGLVRVPVKLHSATESKRIAFKERHAADGAAIEHRRVCVKERKEVPYDEIVKGFEVSAGSYVVLSKEELAIADGPQARVVEIDHFVAEEEIDPIFYERAYYLSPGKLGEEPYRVLHAALLASGKVGIGRFVFHNKEHLAAVRALGDAIVMQTMRFADEIVPESQLELPRSLGRASKLEVDTAQLLIDQLDAEFEPDRYKDTYRDAVMALIERKARGEAIEPAAREPVTREADLLDVLKRSIEQQGGGKGMAKGRASRRTATRKSTSAGGDAAKPAPAKGGNIKRAAAKGSVDKRTAPKRAPTKRGGR